MKFLSLIFLAAFIACAPVDNTVPIDDAYNQVYFAVQYKSKQCNPNSQPALPLVIPVRPLQRHLDLCTIAITENTECPFVNYPIACLMIYLPDDTPIPWYLNFKTLLTVQIK